MPTSYRLTLAPKQSGLEPPAPLHLHALVSTLLSESDDEHRANDKAWSAAPPAVQGNRLYLTLNWLSDDLTPDFAPLREEGVRLGSSFYTVEEIALRQVPYGLLGMDAGSGVEMQFISPTWFTRGSGEYALPDPYLVFRRLSDRWDVLCPQTELLDADALDEVLDSVRITRFEGRTRPFESGRARKTGFVGWARYQLPGKTSRESTSVLTSLSRFAAFAGVGAMTTYGAGHVEVEVPRAGPGHGRGVR